MKAKLFRVLFIAVLLASLVAMLPIPASAQSIVVSGLTAHNYSYLGPSQGKSWYANGRWWVAWNTGGTAYYRSSTTGGAGTWGASQTLCTGLKSAIGYDFSIWFDSTYVHYASVPTGMHTINYRMGTPNGGTGVIDWLAGEQQIALPLWSAYFPSVCTDSNGYPWFAYVDGNGYPYIYKSSTKNGTWTTDVAAGAPWKLAKSLAYPNVTILPLTNGKMAAVYVKSSGVTIQRYDGGSWGAEASSASMPTGIGGMPYYWAYSATTQNDTVHIVFLDTAYDIRYTSWQFNVFSAETVLMAGAESDAWPTITRDTTTNSLHIFWKDEPTDEHIYYKSYYYPTSTWSSTYDLIDESVGDRTDLDKSYTIGSDGIVARDKLAVYYQAGTTNEILKFKWLDEPFVVTTLVASAVTTTTATLNGEIVSESFGTAAHRGFYINTVPNLIGATQHDEAAGGYGVGVFNHGVAGLSNGLNYFYIAYATNTFGTEYGLWVQFTAGGSGGGFVVETLTPTNIGSGGATFNANVLNVGPGITWHGFEYGKTVASMVQWTEASGNVTGAYSHAVTGLDEDSLYYVRAMIGNATATSYGEYVGFFTIWTSAEPPAKAYMDITVTGNCTSDYDYVSLFTTDVVHTALINAGYINGNATDTQLTVFMNGAIPYLPVSDRLAFMLTDFANNEERTLRYYLGTTALQDDFLITVGFNGNMTTADKDVLEPGNTWQIDVSGYLDMSSGNASNWNKYIFYKQDALSLYIGGLGNLTATIGNDTAPTKSISVAGIDSGSHMLTVDSNAVDFRLYVDGTLMASTPTSSVGNNTNPWYFMGNNSLVAMDYFKLSVATIEKLWYQPTAYVSGTNVVDRDGTGNGTINWGTNPSCITIRVGSILSNSIPPEGGGDGTMWTVPPGASLTGWFGGCANVANQPFYATFLSAATEMGMPVCSLYIMMMLSVCAAVGLGTLVFTGSIMISVVSTAVCMLAAANTTVVPVWMMFTFVVIAISIVYLSRQT